MTELKAAFDAIAGKPATQQQPSIAVLLFADMSWTQTPQWPTSDSLASMLGAACLWTRLLLQKRPFP
jgi:hypothetical protein